MKFVTLKQFFILTNCTVEFLTAFNQTHDQKNLFLKLNNLKLDKSYVRNQQLNKPSAVEKIY